MKRKELEWKDEKEMKKGEWDGEDSKLLLPKLDGLLRCGKSCRGHWSNCLRSGINRCAFTSEEENLVIHLHAILGNRWSFIAEHLPGRTDDDIKNLCNVRLKKHVLSRVGTSLDPQIHEQAMIRLLNKSSLYSPSRNSEPDIFLRLWNSPVGESFRNFNPKGKAKCQNFDSQLSPFLNCASGSGLTMDTCLDSEATEFKVPITVAEGMNSGLNSNSWSKKKDPSTMKMLELLCSNEVSFLEDYVDDHSIFLNH